MSLCRVDTFSAIEAEDGRNRTSAHEIICQMVVMVWPVFTVAVLVLVPVYLTLHEEPDFP